MNDLDWLDNELLRSGALRPALAPTHWLNGLNLALAGQEHIARATGALDRFRCAPWPAPANPLAVLGLAIGGATAQAPAEEMALDAPADHPGVSRRAWPVPADHPGVSRRAKPAPGAARDGTSPGGRQVTPDFGIPGPVQHRPAPGAPGTRDDHAPIQPGTPAIPAPDAHRLPKSGPTTIPTRQLAALASGQADQTRGHGAAPAGNGTAGVNHSAGRTPPGYGGNGHHGGMDQSSARYSPAGAAGDRGTPSLAPADRSPVSPALPAEAPRATARRLLNLGQHSAGASRAAPPDPALAGAALLARLTEPPATPGANLPDGLPDLTRRAIDQAFRQTVQPDMLPIGRLAALAARSDRFERPSEPHAHPATAPGSERGTPAPGPAGMALLRESVAAFSNAEPRQEAAAPAHPASTLPPVSAAPAERAPEHARAPDLLAPSGGAAEAIGLPAAVQNTFNVTVHMAGNPDHGEDELADRLTRILVEQARRHGIEI